MAAGLRPPPKLTISQWADRYRQLSPEASAGAGAWRTSRAEYQRGMMDAAHDPTREQIVMMLASQVGKTEILNNVLGYFVHVDPCPMLVLQPTLEMAETWSKDRLAPMIRDTPVLTSLFGRPNSRSAGNTIRHKIFPGGHVTAVGANSPAGLAMRPIRNVLADELDRHPISAGTEGDPLSLAMVRTRTFWNRKIWMVGTPTIKGASRIDQAYSESTRDQYWVPCPYCGSHQVLVWEQVRWAADQDPCYVCIACDHRWSDADRLNGVRNGEWRMRKPESRIRGFHLPEMYSPWVRIEEMVRDFLSKKRSPDTLQTWINTSMAKVWEERSSIDLRAEDIAERGEYWEALPLEAMVITAGVDVQLDRLEVELVAHSPRWETWSVAYEVIQGNPRLPVTEEGSPWKRLEELRKERWPHASGKTLGCAGMFVDSGFLTDEVYAYTKPRELQRVYACKGFGGQGHAAIKSESTNNDAEALIITVGVDGLKSEIMSQLKVAEPGPHYVHFPDDRDPLWVAGLLSEVALPRERKGQKVIEWVKKRSGPGEPEIRNEPLDCRVYAKAALKKIRPRWAALRRKLQPADTTTPAETDQAEPVEPEEKRPRKRRRSPRRRGGYVRRY